MKPWSKLQSALYNLMDRSDNFQIHCVAYRMPNSCSHTPQIPRYWITVGKGEELKIIWDVPSKNFPPPDSVERYEYLGAHIERISDLIREYINTPRDEVLNKVFDTDYYGLTEILKKYDRRFNSDTQ